MRSNKSRRKGLLWALLGLILLVIILIAVIMYRTSNYSFGQTETGKNTALTDIHPSEEALRRFAGGIRIPTVSNEAYEETNFTPFDQFKVYLRNMYPAVYETMDTTVINEYGLVFRWKGRNPELEPILFLSHYDVVPVDDYVADSNVVVTFNPQDKPFSPIDSLQNGWNYPPFSGAVADGRVYGRGTLDMKCMLFALMESAESLLEQDFQPERDIWFAFGQDEEVSGRNGALKIAQHFNELGLRFEAVYDEGGIINSPSLGISKPVAVIGLAEKGFLTLRLRVRGIGGHSSMPPKKGSLVLAAELIQKLNDNQMPARLTMPIEGFLHNVGGEMNYASRMAISNQWLFKGRLLKTLADNPTSNALIRTTTAVTMARGSEAANVMSSISEITVNFRILQGENIEDVMKHVEQICEGYDVTIEKISEREPSAISPTDTRAYRAIVSTLGDLYPDILVSPYITIGGTDSYKYQIVSNNIYRFMPLYLNPAEQRTIHNDNEHITIENYGKMMAYFKNIMEHYESF